MKQCDILWILVGALWAAILPLMSLAGAPDTGSCIRLRNAIVDTSAAAQQALGGVLNAQSKMSADSESMRAQFGDAGRRLPFIIQFTGPVQQAWKQAVTQTGARLGGYLPNNAFIVELTSDQLSRVAALESVQWVGPYKPDYKMDPTLSRRVAGAQPCLGARNAFGPVAMADEIFTIQTFSSETVTVVRDAVLGGNGQVLSVSSSGRRGLLRVRMSVARASELLGLPEVEFIEVYVAPQLHNNVATDSEHMNVQSLWTSHNLTGAGQIVCVADTGLDTGNTNTIHPDFSNRVIAAFALGRPVGNDWADSTQNGGHGTHVAGSVLGSGAAWSNGLFRGVAYEASLVMQSIMDSDGGLGGLPNELADLFWQAYAAGARIHTDSWGSAVYGEYTVDSQSADQFVWDVSDMLVLFSAGNSGVDANGIGVIDTTAIGAPATAKNVLTVGAAESKRPAGSGGYSAYAYGTGSWLPNYSANPIRDDLISTAFDTYQGMAAFSSRGPCIDGRLKPDIVAPGTDIISCRSRMPGAGTLWGTGAGVLANAASNYYTFSGGTSMSTPLTAGAAALVRQYLQEHRGFAAPSAALMKAVLVNGARSLTPGQYGVGQYREIPGTRPNNVEGWGQVDLANTLFPSAGLTNAYYDMTSPAYAIGTGGVKLYSFISSGTNRLSITLCWSDYPASLSASEQLVNDLDLTVITPDGILHYPNGRTSADRLNNVEGVDVSAVTPGTIRIRVSGYNVPNGPQPYALVIHGAELVPAPAVEGDFDGDRLADPYWPVKSDVQGMWTIWRSSVAYTPVVPVLNTPLAGGQAIRVADFENDGLADLAMVANGNWYLWLSSIGYPTPQGPSFTMAAPSGATVNWVAADFDGDRKADPAMVVNGNWYIWLSLSGYPTPQGPSIMMSAPSGADCLAADFDGDRKADPAMVVNGNWYICMSKGGGYVQQGPYYYSAPGTDPVPMVGDFDNDVLADPAMVVNNNWIFWLSTGGYRPCGPYEYVP